MTTAHPNAGRRDTAQPKNRRRPRRLEPNRAAIVRQRARASRGNRPLARRSTAQRRMSSPGPPGGVDGTVFVHSSKTASAASPRDAVNSGHASSASRRRFAARLVRVLAHRSASIRFGGALPAKIASTISFCASASLRRSSVDSPVIFPPTQSSPDPRHRAAPRIPRPSRLPIRSRRLSRGSSGAGRKWR